MNHIEFSYVTEDGQDVSINGSGKIIHESNYGSDHEDHKGYPLKTVTNIKFKCVLNDGSLLNKKELSEDDITNIEDIISNTLSEFNEGDEESGFDYDYED